jgi:hypothetical protein
MEKLKKYLPWIIATVAVAWLFLALSKQARGQNRVALAPGKTPPSARPDSITPNAGGAGSKEQPMSPARARTALRDDDTPFVARLREGGSIAASIMADKLSGSMS